MLPLRDRAFSDRAQYFLDNAGEHHDINGGVLAAVSLYGNPDKINQIVERQPQHVAHRPNGGVYLTGEGSTSKQEAITEYALEELFPRIDEPRRKGLVHRAQLSEYEWLGSQAEWLASCALGDLVEGGSLIKWKPRKRLTARGRMFKNDVNRLHAPKFIRRYIKQHLESELGSARERWVGAAALADKYGADDSDAVHLAIINDISAQFTRLNLRARETALSAAPDKKRRKILKRAAALVVATLGASTMTALARGEPIVIPGEKFDLQLIVPDLLLKGHGGIHASVLDKEKRHSLAKLCVYVKETLAIDQVVSMGLHMQSGLEDEILNTANVTTYENGGDGHPLFVERERAKNLERQATVSLDPIRERFDAFVRAQEVFPPEQLVNLEPIAGRPLPQLVSLPMGSSTTVTTIPYSVASTGATTFVCMTNAVGTAVNSYVTPLIATGSITTSANHWIGPIYTQLPPYNAFDVLRGYQRKYWEDTHEIWEETVRVQVMGARAAKDWGQKVRKAA